MSDIRSQSSGRRRENISHTPNTTEERPKATVVDDPGLAINALVEAIAAAKMEKVNFMVWLDCDRPQKIER